MQMMPRQAGLVLRFLRLGIIGIEHIVDGDMLSLARLYIRARRIQDRIAKLKRTRRERTQPLPWIPGRW